MKLFTEGSIEFKIIIALVFVILFNFIYPNVSNASVGGILFEPMKDFLLVVADGIMYIIQSMMFGMDSSFLTINYSHDWIGSAVGVIAGIVAGGVCVVVGLAGAPFSGGVSLAAVAAGIKIAVTTITIATASGLAASYIVSNALPEQLMLPIFAIGPGEIFKGQVAMLDVNFFKDENDLEEGQKIVVENGRKYIETTTETGQVLRQSSSTIELRSTIKKWYDALRNLAVLILLLILVYIGIRIVISSAADDRAKYKQRLVDWLVAMCLLFGMNYIMYFAVELTETLTDMIATMNDSYAVVIGTSKGDGAEDARNLDEFEYEEEDGGTVFDGTIADSLRDAGIIVQDPEDEDNEQFIWPTNEMGLARIQLQLEPQDRSSDDILIRKFGYTVIYLALVMYTVLFLVRYLKRVLMIAFLTIIAPLMAMTYPLDKLQDGSAQGFNTWLKEYIYNLLIQPVHLILYTMLIGTSMDLVTENLVYALVALGFMLQAEKLLRKFFGFEKASTLASGSALGGALAMQGITQVSKLIGKGGKPHKEEHKDLSNGKTSKKPRVRTADDGNDINSLLDNTMSGAASQASNQLPGNGNNATTAISSSSGSSTPQLPANTSTVSANNMQNTNTGTQVPSGGTLNSGTLNGGTSNSSGGISRTQAYHNLYGASSGGTINNSSSVKPKRTIKNKIGSGMKSVGKAARYIAPRAARSAIKTGARVAVKGTLAGAGMIAGVAAGLVSDDFSNVFKYGAAGVGAGLVAGNGVTNFAGSLGSFGDGLIEAAEREYEATHTDEEIEARQNKIADKQALNDSKRLRTYQQKLNVDKKEAKRIMKEEAQKYREAGVTDDSTIIKAMQYQDNNLGSERDSSKRIALAAMASKIGDDSKKLGELTKGLREKGISDEDIKTYNEAIKKMNHIV